MMTTEDLKDIKSEVISKEYDNGHVSFMVVTTYKAHTLYNQIDNVDDADKVKENHISYIVSVYAGSNYIYDPITKSIIDKPVEVVDASVGKKRGKRKKEVVEVEETIEDFEEVEEPLDDPDGDFDDDKVEELNFNEDHFISPVNISEDDYQSFDDYYNNDHDD